MMDVLADTVRTEVAEPPARRLATVGLSETVSPPELEVAVNETLPENPLRLVTSMFELLVFAGEIRSDVGVAAIENGLETIIVWEATPTTPMESVAAMCTL